MSLLSHPLELLAPARDADIGSEVIKHGAKAVCMRRQRVKHSNSQASKQLRFVLNCYQLTS